MQQLQEPHLLATHQGSFFSRKYPCCRKFRKDGQFANVHERHQILYFTGLFFKGWVIFIGNWSWTQPLTFSSFIFKPGHGGLLVPPDWRFLVEKAVESTRQMGTNFLNSFLCSFLMNRIRVWLRITEIISFGAGWIFWDAAFSPPPEKDNTRETQGKQKKIRRCAYCKEICLCMIWNQSRVSLHSVLCCCVSYFMLWLTLI